MRWQLFSISLIAILSACQENDLNETSGVKGTVSGVDADGTEFTEEFEFTYVGSDMEKFELLPLRSDFSGGATGTIFVLRRALDESPTSPYIQMKLLLENPGLSNQSLSILSNDDQVVDEFQFYFIKEKTQATLMEVTCNGFIKWDWFRTISLEANKSYHFVVNSNGDPILTKSKRSITSRQDLMTYFSEDLSYLNTQGDTIHFLNSSTYSPNNSAVPYKFDKIVYANGASSNVDVLYKDLIYEKKEYGIDCCRFLLNTPNGPISLEEYFNWKNGETTILNAVYDYDNGHLKFDFQVKINGAPGDSNNSTTHPITITGTFDSGPEKIYHP